MSPLPYKLPHPLPAPRQLIPTLTHTTDAILQATVSKTHTTDGYLVDRITTTHTTDALVALIQFLRPDADVTATGWDTAPTASQSLYAQVDESPYSDTDYIFPDSY